MVSKRLGTPVKHCLAQIQSVQVVYLFYVGRIFVKHEWIMEEKKEEKRSPFLTFISSPLARTAPTQAHARERLVRAQRTNAHEGRWLTTSMSRSSPSRFPRRCVSPTPKRRSEKKVHPPHTRTHTRSVTQKKKGTTSRRFSPTQPHCAHGTRRRRYGGKSDTTIRHVPTRRKSSARSLYLVTNKPFIPHTRAPFFTHSLEGGAVMPS